MVFLPIFWRNRELGGSLRYEGKSLGCGVGSVGPMQLGAWPGGCWLPWWAAPYFVLVVGVLLVM